MLPVNSAADFPSTSVYGVCQRRRVRKEWSLQ